MMQRGLLVPTVFFAALACNRAPDPDKVRADETKCPVCPSVAINSMGAGAGAGSETAGASDPTMVPLDLPTSKVVSPLAMLTIDPKGGLVFQGAPIALADLEKAARSAIAKAPDLRVTIAADPSVVHGTVISVLETLRKAGITKVSFAVAKVP